MTLTNRDPSSSADAVECVSANVDLDEAVVGSVVAAICAALILGGFLLYHARRNGLIWAVARVRYLVRTHQAANFDKGLEMALEKLSQLM